MCAPSGLERSQDGLSLASDLMEKLPLTMVGFDHRYYPRVWMVVGSLGTVGDNL